MMAVYGAVIRDVCHGTWMPYGAMVVLHGIIVGHRHDCRFVLMYYGWDIPSA